MSLEMTIDKMLEEGEKLKWMLYQKAELERLIRVGMDAADELDNLLPALEEQKRRMRGFLCIR